MADDPMQTPDGRVLATIVVRARASDGILDIEVRDCDYADQPAVAMGLQRLASTMGQPFPVIRYSETLHGEVVNRIVRGHT